MFSLCVEQVSRMEYNPEGEDCGCRKSKDDIRRCGKHEHKETPRTKKVSSPAALWSPQEQSKGKDTHFFGRTKKVSAPPSAQFEALLSAACHLREAERQRKRSAHEPASTQHHHGHHQHLFQQRHQSPTQIHYQQLHPSTNLQRHLAHHHPNQGQYHEQQQGSNRQSPTGDGDVPVPPQRKANGDRRKERKKGSAMTPPTLEQLEAAVLQEAAKHGKRNTGPVHPLNIFGRTKKVSAPPVAQFEALLAANTKLWEDKERKRSVHAPGTNRNHAQHHNNEHHGLGHLLHHPPQRLDNIDLLSPEPALLSQRKCMGEAGHRKRVTGEEEPELSLDGLWISRCEGEVVKARTPAERMAHELDSALAAAAKRRKEKALRVAEGALAGKRAMTPAEALGAEMDSALAAALIRRERKLTTSGGHGKDGSGPLVSHGAGRNILHRSTEMLSRG